MRDDPTNSIAAGNVPKLQPRQKTIYASLVSPTPPPGRHLTKGSSKSALGQHVPKSDASAYVRYCINIGGARRMPIQPSLHRAVRRLGSSAIGTGLFGSPASLTALNRACRYGAASEAKSAASRSPLWLKFGLVAPPPLLLGCFPCRIILAFLAMEVALGIAPPSRCPRHIRYGGQAVIVT
jgi:hypothetical protein